MQDTRRVGRDGGRSPHGPVGLARNLGFRAVDLGWLGTMRMYFLGKSVENREVGFWDHHLQGGEASLSVVCLIRERRVARL